MLSKEDPISKKITVITGFIIAITGLIAAWTSFAKVMNPPPLVEKKAEMAYELLREKVTFQDEVIRDTREQISEIRMILMSRSYHVSEYDERPRTGRAPASAMPVQEDIMLKKLTPLPKKL
jgi:hypothetical protein